MTKRGGAGAYEDANSFCSEHVCVFIVILFILVFVALWLCFTLWNKSKAGGKQTMLDAPIGWGHFTSGAALRYKSVLDDAAHDADYIPIPKYTETTGIASSGHPFSSAEAALMDNLHGDTGDKYVWDPQYGRYSQKWLPVPPMGCAPGREKEGFSPALDPRPCMPGPNKEGLANQPKSEDSLFASLHGVSMQTV